MNRKEIPISTQRALFSACGNECQNPECKESIARLNYFEELYHIWEQAHIEWYSKDWPRANSENLEDNSFDNLLILCPNCHTKIDKDPSSYPTELLREWKDLADSRVSWEKSVIWIWWKLKCSTKKRINTDLVLNWRWDYQDELFKRLTIWGQKIEIRSDSQFESYAFIIATLLNNSEYDIEPCVVGTQDEFNKKISEKEIQSIIPEKWLNLNNIGKAITQGHNVILYSWVHSLHAPLSFDSEIVLPTMERHNRISALQDILWSENHANDVYRDTKWYLFPILRNELLEFNETLKPEWLGKYQDDVLCTIFLINEWKEWSDKELIEFLSWLTYWEFEQQLESLAKEDDAPIRKIQDVWQLISKKDIWIFIQNKLSKSILDRLLTVAPLALSDLDPKYNLPKNKRWFSLEKWEFSNRSKEAISNSLALLSISSNKEINSYITKIIASTFETVDDVPKLLNSLWSCMRDLAEASPNQFMDYIEKNINTLEPLFERWDMIMWWGWASPNLLWALEIISWNTDYTSRVASILFQLHELYFELIPENYGNSPMGSLQEIFVWWIDNCNLDMDQRVEIFKSQATKYPQTVFDIVMNLATKTSSWYLIKPTYQNWDVLGEWMDRSKYYEYMWQLIDIAINIFENNVEYNIVSILENYTKFSEGHFRRIVQILLVSDITSFKSQAIIQKSLNEIETSLHDKRVYWYDSILTKVEWLEDELIKVHEHLRPSDLILWSIWLFEYDQKIIMRRIDEYKKESKSWERSIEIANEERIIVLEDIYNTEWVQGVMRLISNLSEYRLLTEAIMTSTIQEDLIVELLKEFWSKDYKYFFRQLIRTLDISKSKELDLILSKLNEYTEDSITNILIWLLLNTRTLELLKDQPDTIEEAFIHEISNLDYNAILRDWEYDELEYYIQLLLKYNKGHIAFNQIASLHHGKKLSLLSNNNILLILENTLKIEPQDIKRIHSFKYNIEHILQYLYGEIEEWNIDAGKIVNIEILFIKVIDDPVYLNIEIANDPKLYVEIISGMFKKHSWWTEVLDAKQKNFADNCYEFLKKFNNIPWSNSNSGKIDYEVLSKWIDESLNKLREADRYEVWCQKIWELLSTASWWPDWVWPNETIRKVLNDYNQKHINIWFSVWKQNSRGVTSRWIYSWWDKERVLAEKYYTDADKIKWKYPVTAEVLRWLWDSYTSEAIRYDEDVLLDR